MTKLHYWYENIWVFKDGGRLFETTDRYLFDSLAVDVFSLLEARIDEN